MDEIDAQDIWAVSDADGPVVYFPVPTGSPVPPDQHVTAMRSLANRATAPDGLIHGVWARARGRLAAGGLTAEIADPEVPTGRAAQRAATMARGVDAVAWVPEAFLAEPEPAAARPRRPRPAATATQERPSSPRRPASEPARPKAAPKPKPAPAPPPEPTEKVCPSCFMMRRLDQFTADGICEFCA